MMQSVFSFVIAGSLVRVVVDEATGEALRVFSPAGFPLSPEVIAQAIRQARLAWESVTDVFCA